VEDQVVVARSSATPERRNCCTGITVSRISRDACIISLRHTSNTRSKHLAHRMGVSSLDLGRSLERPDFLWLRGVPTPRDGSIGSGFAHFAQIITMMLSAMKKAALREMQLRFPHRTLIIAVRHR
jgi:hypothetical protein